MYTRLNDATLGDAFKTRVVRFYHLISSLNTPPQSYGTDYFLAASESAQANAFTPLYLKVILPTTQTLTRPLDRKAAAISLTKNLTDSEAFKVRYKKGWAFTCESLILLLENAPTLHVGGADEVVEQDVDDLGFGVGFTQLNTCKRVPRDLYPEVQDIKSWVGQYWKAADQKATGEKLGQMAAERLTPEVQQKLGHYVQ